MSFSPIFSGIARLENWKWGCANAIPTGKSCGKSLGKFAAQNQPAFKPVRIGQAPHSFIWPGGDSKAVCRRKEIIVVSPLAPASVLAPMGAAFLARRQ